MTTRGCRPSPSDGDNPGDIQPFSNLFNSRPTALATAEGATARGSSGTTRTRRTRDGDGRAGGAGSVGTREVGEVDVHNGVAPPKEYYTNAELYQLLRPDGEAIPYAYDNFEWPHCDVSRRVPDVEELTSAAQTLD